MAEPDALLIDALTQLSQQGGYEAAGAELYPGLYPTPTAPMPSFDGGRGSRGDLYGRSGLYGGARPLGGAGLLGGLPRPPRPDMDTTPGEQNAAAAAEGWIPPTPAPVGPEVPDWIVENFGEPYPGVSAGPLPEAGGLLPPRPTNLPFPSTDTGRIPARPRPGVGGPQPLIPPVGANVIADRTRQVTRPAPGDVAPGDVGMVPRPSIKADQPGFISHRFDDDDYKGLGLSDDRKAEIETAASNAKDYLRQGGYIDTGPHGLAQSLMLLYGGGLEPTVTQGPAVQFNVRGQPMTTDRYLNFATGSPSVPSILPEGRRLGQVAPSGDVATTAGDTDTKGTTMGGGSLGLGDFEIQKYLDNKMFDVIGSNLYPEVKIATDGQRYFDSEADIVNWAGGFMEETGIDAKPYFYETFINGIKKTGNYILDGAQSFLNVIQDFADFVGDPSKAKGQDATYESLGNSYNGFINELTEFWNTNPNNLWGRNMFKPGETQKYGSLQPYAIISALSNPPVAMFTAAKTLIKDIMWSAKNMFAEEANYDGNYVQDIINGAFHLVGSGIKSFGKNFKKLVKGDKTAAAGETPEDSKWLEDIAGKLEKSTDDKMRDKWLIHAAFDSPIHKITKAFLSEGIPVVLKDNKDKFIKAINDRKMDDFFGLMDEFRIDDSIFDLLAGAAGLDPNNAAEANMIEILRAWERQRKANR